MARAMLWQAAMWMLAACRLQGMAAQRKACAYQASDEQKRGARHLGYSLGVARPKERETAADRHEREVSAWFGPLGGKAAA